VRDVRTGHPGTVGGMVDASGVIGHRDTRIGLISNAN
jgi:hypothetical protein